MATKYQGPADRLDAYRRAIERLDDVALKGAANPYTSRNGYMTSFLDRTGSMGLRLDADDRERFIGEYGTGLAEQYGKVMREFAVVPDHLLDDTDTLVEWMRRGDAWVATLPPK